MGTIVIIALLIVLILMFIPGKKEGNKINRNYKKIAHRLLIHGTTRHRDDLEDFYDSHEKELTFERETDNSRDRNAIKILGND